ncbi:MAG: dUTP diphosphatase [Candidatus Hydrogenedentota bacterium]|nr:MAG: dUTP diphosphatase [Candidatus Hydrogenedentota bacterium]
METATESERSPSPADAALPPPVKVRVKRLYPEARIPEPAHFGDSGVDLRSCIEDISLPPGQRAIIPTGLAFEIPVGYEIQIRPRSGLAAKKGLTCLNAPGTIDSGYRGEVKVILYNSSRENVLIRKGDRIAQAVLARVERIEWEETDALTESSRGTGGFGSTGV